MERKMKGRKGEAVKNMYSCVGLVFEHCFTAAPLGPSLRSAQRLTGCHLSSGRFLSP